MTFLGTPVLRVTSMVYGLQLDAAVVPAGRVRIAVVDQDERGYDLVLRGENDVGLIGALVRPWYRRGWIWTLVITASLLAVIAVIGAFCGPPL